MGWRKASVVLSRVLLDAQHSRIARVPLVLPKSVEDYDAYDLYTK